MVSKSKQTDETTPTLISADLKVTGNLQTDGDIQIDGNVEGDIACKKLTIGDTAVISGEIKADEVEVRGRVQGQIRSRSVLLTKSAQVVGDVWYQGDRLRATSCPADPSTGEIAQHSHIVIARQPHRFETPHLGKAG